MKTSLKLVLLSALLGLADIASASPIDVFTTAFPNSYPTLESIDLATGSIVPLGTVQWGGVLNDIAQDPISGQLYGLSGANLFTISVSGSIGKVTPVTTSGMSGSMETLAFDNAGALYIGTQSGLYSFNFTSNGRDSGVASYVGDYGNSPYLNNQGQNIRFENNTLYLANTAAGTDTALYTVSQKTGAAEFVGIITNQPALVLGNYNGHIYGSSVPAINGQNAPINLLDFGPQITVSQGNGNSPSVGGLYVNYTAVGSFPQNENFSGTGYGGVVAAVPEPGTYILFGLGILGLITQRKYGARV